MGSGTSLEDFYPSIAINSLMKILKDHSLSQHHTMAIQALGFIFKSLAIKSVPYLPQVRSERGMFTRWCPLFGGLIVLALIRWMSVLYE
jgi:FKBP12-rapamycin complex-associated protein